MPAAVQRLRMSPSCQRLTLRWVGRTISIIDSIGFVEDSVFESRPVIPSRISVSVSVIPSRSDAAASGHLFSSSAASRSSCCSASTTSFSAHAPRTRPRILARVRGAWALKDVVEAEQQLERLAAELEKSWPDAAASLREGMTETLTLIRLGITGRLAKTLSSTNPIESMIEIVRPTQRNVKRWQDGDMRKRWTAAGMLEAEQQFRRIVGYSDLAKLVTAIEQRHLTLESPNLTRPAEEVTATEDAAQLATV